VKCDGSLWSWGINCFGKLGLGDTNPRFEIQPVGNSCDWAQIISGWDHSSAIKCNGSLWSWGKGECGLTGLNISTDTCVPTLLDCGPWKSVSADSQGGKALKCDGTLWLWGRDDCGRIGNNYYNEYAKTCFSSPVQTISGGTDWCSISNRYSFAIKTNGTLWGWGNNGNGQLGTDDTIPRSSPTQTVSGGTNWKQVIATLENLFATKTDGTLWSAGRNYAGQLGTGDNISKSSPVQTTAGGTNWRCLLESTSSVFATKNDGTLWGWGRNTYTLPSDPGGYAVFGTCLNDYIVTSPIQICNGVKGFWKTGSGGMFQTFIGVFESEADDL
jgi:alpha-tubulin suppressor-like RCC1 family protein